MLNRLVSHLEKFFFGHRFFVLATIGLFTAVMAVFAVQLRMDAGFEKQMPVGHEYVRTFLQYRNDLLGANRITVVVRAKHGPIWTPAGLSRLYKVTEAVTYLPNVDRSSVRSLWTPNAFVNEITDEGFRAEPIIAGTITPDRLTPGVVAQIRRSTTLGGYVGTLVSHDEDSAMITAELNERDRSGKVLDYVAFNRRLEQQIRAPFEDAGYEIQIIGFAKQIGDIADGATAVLGFCAIALVLTALAVYWYCHSIRFTVLLIACSLTSLIWQFGTLQLLGFGLDPLGVLVPFLVFAIGVSHGVQQVNFIVREIAHGHSSYVAARHSFSGLLIPGVLALVTAFVSFITLLLIPIPMVRELAVTASLGVAYKIVTNLVLLPVAASCFNFTKQYAERSLARAQRRARPLRVLARVAEPKYAAVTVALTVAVFALAAWQSRDRVIGTLQPGAPELRADARFNRDATSISGNYDMGLDWLTIAVESSAKGCNNPAIGLYEDDFAAAMRAEPGVVSVQSYAGMLRAYNQGYNEAYPKMNVVPVDPENYGAVSVDVGRMKGLMSSDCGMTAVHLFLTDHKATTINRILDDVKQFRASHPFPGITVRLAAGNAGVLAATNDEVEKSERPMMLYVYAAILILVFLAYRDWRAMLACCVPLSVATFIGYGFMKALQIGLTVATLPVMVLAVGVGVDYAFYIYNRLQVHLAGGQGIVKAVQHAMLEVGVATIFTAITLAIGVATWSFSALKFQADMGKLLAFMFLVNLLMAMTALPALASVLERWFPRRKPARAPGLFSH
ncbi:efflux RND transporter permease subunit [Burkholderia multivorans]|uniref:efflux RND transporter permease subunit n=1 Tax=Burkholderia multivorans TaxID=87883 RepID=UPI0002780C82|nr:efflux RND transporter permease subunit [Burkholderia multivorans]EJO56385.1 MMPL family protein [Burkholderia multivorans CF2]MBJ9653231.1 MMPL family transporter [Burkholderia multivorans]MBR8043604.1 MMPL family transporter [Burkholderia multivorans]MBU9469478.1 MMPL family transporter [Burkholderia multivorans]MDR8873208.1 Acyltrehalose exporter MmpL10 [Burkholderia multivorans]